MRADFCGFPELDPVTEPLLRNKIVSLHALCSLVSRIRTSKKIMIAALKEIKGLHE